MKKIIINELGSFVLMKREETMVIIVDIYLVALSFYWPRHESEFDSGTKRIIHHF